MLSHAEFKVGRAYRRNLGETCYCVGHNRDGTAIMQKGSDYFAVRQPYYWELIVVKQSETVYLNVRVTGPEPRVYFTKEAAIENACADNIAILELPIEWEVPQ